MATIAMRRSQRRSEADELVEDRPVALAVGDVHADHLRGAGVDQVPVVHAGAVVEVEARQLAPPLAAGPLVALGEDDHRDEAVLVHRARQEGRDLGQRQVARRPGDAALLGDGDAQEGVALAVTAGHDAEVRGRPGRPLRVGERLQLAAHPGRVGRLGGPRHGR